MKILEQFSIGKKTNRALFDANTEVLDPAFEALPIEVLAAIDDLHYVPGDVAAPALAGELTGAHAFAGSGRSVETPYTQGRLAALADIDEGLSDFQGKVDSIEDSLSQIGSIYAMARDFLDTAHADLRRANELENMNVDLQDEVRRITGRAEQAETRAAQLEGAAEAQNKREAGLREDIEKLRAQLLQSKSSLAEAERTLTRAENERFDFEKKIGIAASMTEKLQRDNDAMREKQVNLGFEAEKFQKQAVEYRRRFDELSAIHESESQRLADTIARNGELENETIRLNREKELASAKLGEAEQVIRGMETDRLDEENRHIAEVHALEEEIKMLTSRLEVYSSELSEKDTENAELRSQLSATRGDKNVAEQKFHAILVERDAARRELMSSNSKLAEANLIREADKMAIETQGHKVDELQKQVQLLTERIKKLAPFERLYRLSKTRLCDIAAEAKIVLAEQYRAERDEASTIIPAPMLRAVQ